MDSLFRLTKAPCKFILTDNGSSDPGVFSVIEGFKRRDFFHAIHLEKENDPLRLPKMIKNYWDLINDVFVIIESDIEILDTTFCWLELMSNYMRQDPNMGALGSRVYKDDFVTLEKGVTIEPNLTEDEINFLIKAKAPMRAYVETKKKLIDPHNPPLRLLMLRKRAYEEVGFDRDKIIYRKLKQNGWTSFISTEVVHRHLSLLNIYDYPSYSYSNREAFFSSENYGK